MYKNKKQINENWLLLSISMLIGVILSSLSCVAPASTPNSIVAPIQTKQSQPHASPTLIVPAQQSQHLQQQQQPGVVPSSQVRQLAQPAPYAIDSNDNIDGSIKNIMFRLSFTNRTLNNGSEDDGKGQRDEDLWSSLMSRNGTIIGTRANFSIKKLLDTLHNNSFTSELKFDEHDRGFVNITIFSAPGSNMSRSLLKTDENFVNSPIDELLLEELIMDANSNWQQSDSRLNTSQVVKDNHRYESKYPMRSKPAASIDAINSITVPPIRSALEVVAENYTIRKISEEANVFSMKLLHQLNIERLGSRNLIQAPFAIYQGLALLLNGAMGETAKEMDKTLLGTQSSYENIKLTHDQDRTRLMASFSDIIRQLQQSATNHLRAKPSNESDQQIKGYSSNQYSTTEQHLIVANNLLFSSSAYEISNEFKNTLNTNYNNTALTKIEVGSTESIQVVNGWIRRATQGVIPSILDKRNTFDEFNVMALLCTSWLAQEWKDTFYKISSPLRSSIRLKGQGRSLDLLSIFRRDDTLLEFFDDSKQSHFVEYIRSRPTKNIHHYHSVFNNMMLDIVAVPFQDSNHRLIAITPVSSSSASTINNITQQPTESSSSTKGDPIVEPTDASLLSRLIALIASNPRKAMRSLWNIIAPEIITKQTLQNIQLARQKNVTIDEQTIETNIIPMVELSIPIIRSEADASVSAALNHIGIVNSFDPNQANFIGINGHPFNYYKLHLSNVVSKTVFNLNERGINYDKTIKTLEALRIFPNRQQQVKRDSPKADTITVDSGHDSIRLEFVDEVKLNKPFMYLICDIKTKLILYTGVVRNPTQEGP